MGGPDRCDPALIELFHAELDAHLPVLSQGLLALEKGQAGEKDLEAMMRAAHSIKGAARIVGVEAAVRVAHVMEDCFSAAQGHRIDLRSEAVDVLLQGVDALQRICAPQADGAVSEPSIQGLLDRIASLRDGRFAAQPQPPASPGPQTVLPATIDPASSGQRRVAMPDLIEAPATELLRGELSDILRSHPSRIRLDFSRVRQVSAAGLSLLASFVRETAREAAPITIEAEGVSAEMLVLLRTSGLDSTIKPVG